MKYIELESYKKSLMVVITSLLLLACNDQKSADNSVIIPANSALCQMQDEKNLALWNYLNDWYLWNDRLDQSTNPYAFDSLQALLDNVKQNNPIDRWSNVSDSKKQDDFFSKGEILSYGFEALLNESENELIVAQVYDDSDASAIGLQRGDSIISINNEPIINAIADGSLLSGEIWGPDVTGTSTFLKWQTPANDIYSGRVQKRTVNINTVLHSSVITTVTSNIGYFVFSNFLAPSAQELDNVFDYFILQDIDELIIDLRYNGGGSSNIANQLATQIAGHHVQNKVFAKYFHNANHNDENTSERFSLKDAKHVLNLDRVTFLTTKYTASASELLINALKPHIKVQLIGTDTHGKPSGFKAAQLCDQTVFAINVTLKNSDDIGDYYDGLPVDCAAEDTLSDDWGQPGDPLLKEALYLLNNGHCSESGQSINSVPDGYKLIKPDRKPTSFEYSLGTDRTGY